MHDLRVESDFGRHQIKEETHARQSVVMVRLSN